MELKKKRGRPTVTRTAEELRAAHRERKRKYETKLKKYAWNYKAERSCECGQSHPAALQFHHRDPTTKLFDIASGHKAKSVIRLQEEIDKCDILCANCHAIHHYENKFSDREKQGVGACYSTGLLKHLTGTIFKNPENFSRQKNIKFILKVGNKKLSTVSH